MLVVTAVASVSPALSRESTGTGTLVLICSTVFIHIEEEVIFDHLIASAKAEVRTVNQSILFL